jgi:hypothetical protein
VRNSTGMIARVECFETGSQEPVIWITAPWNARQRCWTVKKTINYAREQNRRSDNAGDHGALGRDPGDRVPGSDACNDTGGARLLPEDGTGMRIVDDAIQPFLLPSSTARDIFYSGIDLFSHSPTRCRGSSAISDSAYSEDFRLCQHDRVRSPSARVLSRL